MHFTTLLGCFCVIFCCRAQDFTATEQLHLLERVEESRASKDTVELIHSLTSVAAFYLNHGQEQKAIYFLTQSEELAAATANQQVIAQVWSYRGLIYAEQGNLSKGERDFKRAVALYRQTDNEVGLAHSLLNLSTILLEQQQFAEAVEHLNEAMQIAKAHHLVPVITDSHHYLSIAYTGLNKKGLARKHQTAYATGFNQEDKAYIASLTQTFRTERSSLHSTLPQTRFELWKKQKELEILTFREREIAALAKARKAKLDLQEKELQLNKKELARTEEKTSSYQELLQEQKVELAFKHWTLVAIALFLLIAIVAVFILTRIIERKKLSNFLIKKRQLIIERQNRELREKNNVIRASEENIKNYISKLKQRNKELHTLNKENKQLIRLVANDLRQPLVNSETLLKMIDQHKPNLSIAEQGALQGIRVANVRLNKLVNRIIDEATIGKLDSNDVNLKTIDISQYLQDSISSFKLSSESKGITIQTLIPPNTKATADDSLLPLVFENLLSNAIKFSPIQGTIHVRLAVVDSKVQISFEDQGEGLSGQDQKHLFKRFYVLSTKPTAGEQTNGLGLSLVKKFMEAMKGNIQYIPKPTGGSIFQIELPLANPSAQTLNRTKQVHSEQVATSN